MTARWFTMFVVFGWLVSMSWLFVSKVLPPLESGEPPHYEKIWPHNPGEQLVTCWQIRWDDQRIGLAATEVSRRYRGAADVKSVVRFHRLPSHKIRSQLLGPLHKLFEPMLRDDMPVEMKIAVHSHLRFGEEGNFESLRGAVHAGGIRRLLLLNGDRHEGQFHLTVRARIGDGDGDGYRTFPTKRISIPSNALATDVFSPHPRLPGLRVGQTWRFFRYRPLDPLHPEEIIEARVERRETLAWHGERIRTFVVAYHPDAGSGLSIAREPVARLWVADDGTVVQQQAQYAGITLSFVRLPDKINARVAAELFARFSCE